MRELASDYGISDRGLAKVCAKADIPVPARGYWNKLQAGLPITPFPLPPRGIGKDNFVKFGGSQYWYYTYPDEKLLNEPLPPAPVFAEDISVIAEKAKALAAKARFPKSLSQPHYLVARLLAEDEKRQAAIAGKSYVLSFEGPLFSSAYEKRRLKIISSLFTALEHCNMQPRSPDRVARGLMVTVGDTNIHLKLENPKYKLPENHYELPGRKPPDSPNLSLEILSYRANSDIHKTWEDGPNNKLENQLREIVEAVILAGEQAYRESELNFHQRLIERKAALEKAERQRLIKEKQERIKRQQKLEQQRVDHLLSQADALQKAQKIRDYVRDVKKLALATNKITENHFNEWAKWALAQADWLDPIVSGQLLALLDESE